MIISTLYFVLVGLVVANVVVSYIPDLRWSPIGRLINTISDPINRSSRKKQKK